MHISVFGVFLLTGEVVPLAPRLLASIRRRLPGVTALRAAPALRVMVGQQLAATGWVEVCCRIETEGGVILMAEGHARTAREAVRQALDAAAGRGRAGAGRSGRLRNNPARAGPAGQRQCSC